MRKLLLRYFFVAWVSVLCGCGESYEVHHYDYEPADVEILDGRIEVNIQGTETLREADGKHYSDWGAPYRIRIIFHKRITEDVSIEKVIAENIVIAGADTEVRVLLADHKEASRFYERGKGMGDISFSLDVPGDEGLEYEPYILSARIIIIEKGKEPRKATISIRLEPKFWKEKRSIAVDRIMSV